MAELVTAALLRAGPGLSGCPASERGEEALPGARRHADGAAKVCAADAGLGGQHGERRCLPRCRPSAGGPDAAVARDAAAADIPVTRHLLRAGRRRCGPVARRGL